MLCFSSVSSGRTASRVTSFAGLHSASVLLTSSGAYSLNVQLATPGGISAAYHTGSWPSTSPDMQRIDSSIGSGAFYSGYSSVRWSGRIASSISGLHTFYVSSQSGARCWIDSVLLLDRWSSPSNLTAFTFTLQASALHLITVDAKSPSDSSPIYFEWASAAFTRERVPSSHLFWTEHVLGSPFDLVVATAPASAAQSKAFLRGPCVPLLRFRVLFVCCVHGHVTS